MKEKGRGEGSELDSDLDPDLDPWKILWIQIHIQQNDADLDPQHWYNVGAVFEVLYW